MLWAVHVFVCAHALCMCWTWGRDFESRMGVGVPERESRTGLYRTCLARVGGAGWGRQEPFQVSEGELEYMLPVYVCVSVSRLDVEGVLHTSLLPEEGNYRRWKGAWLRFLAPF